MKGTFTRQPMAAFISSVLALLNVLLRCSGTKKPGDLAADCLRLLSVCFALSAGSAYSLHGQVSGTVFRDYNANGVQGLATPNLEPGVAGVIVNAYNTSNVIIASFTSDAAGGYNIPSSGAAYNGSPGSNTGFVGAGTAVRLEFVIPASAANVCRLSSNIDYTSYSGGNYGSSVQFVSGGATNVNFAINNPADYASATNPNMAVSCYVNGSTTGTGVADALVSFPYTSSGTTAPAHDATKTDIGAIWGLAYHRSARRLFTSAVLKRHVGLTSAGLGAIFINDYSTAGVPSNLFMDLENPPYNINLGTFNISDAARGLANDTDPSHDAEAYTKVGTVGLGDIDISDDDRYLFAVNLHLRTVIKIDLGTGALPVAPAGVQEFPLPAGVGCTNGVLRPFALKYYRQKLYVGAVCTGESELTNTNANLVAYILEFDPATNAFAPAPVLTVPLNYVKAEPSTQINATVLNNTKRWFPWFNGATMANYTNPNYFDTDQFVQPQPMLTDIEFLDNGAMILDFADRMGFQWGWNNYGPDPTDNALYKTAIGGEILLAYPNSSCSWQAESNGQFTGISGSPVGCGVGNIEGPGGGEFYCGDVWINPANPFHKEVSMGAAAVLRGSGEHINTMMDPDAFFSGGTRRLSGTDGSWVSGSGYMLYVTPAGGTGATFGKAQGLGDLELLGVKPPIEIGNRVWMDTDNDGIQDPGEMGLGGVVVKLYQGATQVGQMTTNADGTYYFNNSNVTMNGATGLLSNTAYTIRVDAADFPAGKLLSTIQNTGGAGQPDVRDNDAALNAGNAEIAVTTGAYGENNHTLDMAFRLPICTLTDAGETLEACNNNATPADGTDDYITFSLNPTGTTLGATYAVTANNGGTVTLAAGGAAAAVNYGAATAFRLQNGSANGTLYTITVTDASGATCVVTTTVQQNACVSCVPPALTIVSGTVCAGSSINLATLVTGNTPAGTLTFHASQADATAGTNALVNTTVAPMATTTYYVRSSLSSVCYTTAALSVTVSTAPALTVMDGTVCPGGSINLASLMTSSGIGTLSYYESLSDAQSGTGMLPPPGQVSPVSAKNYYIRITNSSGCFSIEEVTATMKPAVCAQPTVTGPN